MTSPGAPSDLWQLGRELVCDCFSFISINFFSYSLDNLALRYHEAVGGFFGASQEIAVNTSFEGVIRSGAVAQCC